MYTSNSNSDLTSSDVGVILRTLGYEWSNEAQCYYSTDFEMGLLTHKQGKELARRIVKNWQRKEDNDETN